MNFKKSGGYCWPVGSHIFANQAFAISTIAKIIDSVVAGPCTQENGKFMYICTVRALRPVRLYIEIEALWDISDK